MRERIREQRYGTVEHPKLPGLDVLLVGVYVVASNTMGSRIGRDGETAETNFLADHDMTWPYIGGSLFGSNISTLIALAGAAYAVGVYNHEWIGRA